MKRILVFQLVVLGFFQSCQSPERTTEGTEVLAYDSVLAKELNADDYGMSQYVMAFLKSGPNRSTDAEDRAELQRAHLDNINCMAKEGKLIVAGPFLDNGDIRGIYIFNVATIEEARALTESDPAIQAGTLVMELHPWYGSAALKQIDKIHAKIAKVSI